MTISFDADNQFDARFSAAGITAATTRL